MSRLEFDLKYNWIKIHNGVLTQLLSKTTRRVPIEQVQQAQNANMEDFDYKIPHTSSIGGLLNNIPQNQKEMIRMKTRIDSRISHLTRKLAIIGI